MPRHLTIELTLNDDRPRIPEVMARETCKVHRAEKNQPCWWLWLLSDRKTEAICNARAKRAGFNAEITPTSMGEGRTFGQS